MKLVILVTAQLELGLTVAEAWDAAGAPGVTIVRSHGLQTLQQEAQRSAIELPLVMGSMAAAMAAILFNAEARSQLIFSVCEEATVDALVAAANHTLGDLTERGHGVLFVLDVERAIGVRRHG